VPVRKALAVLSIACLAALFAIPVWDGFLTSLPDSVQEAFVLGLFGAAFLGTIYIILFLTNRELVGRAAPETVPERVRTVRASGPCLAHARPSLRLGETTTRGSGLSVSVYPGGIVLKPMLMPAQAILIDEISRAYVDSPRGYNELVVEHNGLGGPSPIYLFGRGAEELAWQLQNLMEKRAAAGETAVAAPAGTPPPLTGNEPLLQGTWGQGVACLICGAMAITVLVLLIPKDPVMGVLATGLFGLAALVCARNFVRGLLRR
jgi:hypothetical protein